MTLMADSSDMMRESVPTPVADEEAFCPACGKLFEDLSPPVSLRPVGRSSWHWVLIAVGLYLILAFRGQALLDSEFLPSSELQTACTQPPGTSSANPKLCVQAIRDKQIFEHDEAAVAIGGLVLLLGVVRLVREGMAAFRLFGRDDRVSLTEHTNRWRFLAIALGVWTFAEKLLLLGLQCLLVIAGATLTFWVVNGTPLSVDLVNAAIKRAVDAAFVLKLMVS